MNEDDFITPEEWLEAQPKFEGPMPRVTVLRPASPVRQAPDVTTEDVRAVISEGGLEVPGVYPASDLYALYLAYADKYGKTPAVQRVWSGKLRRMGAEPKSRAIDGVNTRCWRINLRVTEDDIPAALQ